MQRRHRADARSRRRLVSRLRRPRSVRALSPGGVQLSLPGGPDEPGAARPAHGPAAADRPALGRAVARWGLVLFYAAAGALHLLAPRPFVSIMPPWVPAPELVVALTGGAELLGALGLAQRRWPALRKAAGCGLSLYALCVWPANVQHMMLDLHRSGLPLTYHIPRLAAQPLLIWLALWSSAVTDWPFRPGAGQP